MDFTDLLPFSPEFGYFGLSLISFFGSLIPFVPIPFLIFLATMAALSDQFNIHILALLSAISATAAKQIIFYLSYTGRRIMKKETRKRMRPFERLVKRYGGAAAFIAAATPIPDDLVYIPLGLAKYDPKRFFLATFSGKLLLSYIVVLGSHFFGDASRPFLEQIEDPTPIYIGIVAFGVLLTVTVILMLRLDWAKILGKAAPWTLEDDENDSKS